MRKNPLLLAGAVSALGIAALLVWPAPSTSQTAPQSGEISKINPEIACPGAKPIAPIEDVKNHAQDLLARRDPPCVPDFLAFDLDSLQHGFDYYSWLTFLALNSPADGKRIGQGPGANGDAPTIWETYKQLPDVMLPDGSRPTDWGDKSNVKDVLGQVPPECAGDAKPGMMVVHMIEETFNQPFKSGPLIDQNGNFALFIILMNQPMFDYIVENTLYSKQGQESFKRGNEKFNGTPDEPSTSPGARSDPPGGIVNFPKGDLPKDATRGTLGAIMLKASWKVVKEEDAGRFHTIDALVYTRAAAKPCVAKKLGLVGFHVGHKTIGAPQWIWTTFEHIDNVPEQREVKTIDKTRVYNFYNPACDDEAKCPVNQTPGFPWDPSKEPFPGGHKSQITRVVAVTDDAVRMNAAFHSILAGTVWKNYMLVSTQWPTQFDSKTDPTGAPAPPFLANTTLETYSQDSRKFGGVPLATSSCIGCHNNATTQHRPATQSDFTFTLEKAH